jgi:hypothetical protein
MAVVVKTPIVSKRKIKRLNYGICMLISIIITSYICFLGLQGGSPPWVAFAAARGPNYMRVIHQSSETTTDTAHQINPTNYQSVRLSLATQGNIPLQADQFIYSNLLTGLGWVAKLDSNSFKIFAMTIHPVLGRDSTQQDPMRWHAHAITLRNDGNNIPQQPHDLCIASIDSSPNAEIAINGNKLSVQTQMSNLPFSSIASFSTAIGFTAQRDSACTTSGLALQISS